MIAAAIVIAGVLISASLFVAVGEAARTITTTETTVATNTTTVTMTATYFTGPTASTDASLLARCAGAPVPVFGFGDVIAGNVSPAILCVKLYYFNSSAPLTLNLSNTISISQSTNPVALGGNSNFTVGVSQDQLVLGGPLNENEGTVVAYSLTSKPGVNGTYSLSIGGPSPYITGPEVAPQIPEQCGSYGSLFAGMQPVRSFETMCITYANTSTSSTPGSPTAPSIPGIQYPILQNHLYFEVVGVINATK
jgi:hypothetical protein